MHNLKVQTWHILSELNERSLPLPGLVVDFTLSDHSHLTRAETTLETTPVTTSACHMKLNS